MSIIGEISTIDSPRSTFWSKYRSYRRLVQILGENSSTSQRNVDVMRIILTGQCKTCIWITPSPYNHRQCISSWPSASGMRRNSCAGISEGLQSCAGIWEFLSNLWSLPTGPQIMRRNSCAGIFLESQSCAGIWEFLRMHAQDFMLSSGEKCPMA